MIRNILPAMLVTGIMMSGWLLPDAGASGTDSHHDGETAHGQGELELPKGPHGGKLLEQA